MNPRLTLIAALDSDGRVYFTLTQANTNSDLMLVFMKHLMQQLDREDPEWQKKTDGSAIRRISYEQWLRNIAIALGNAHSSAKVIAALRSRLVSDSEIVRAHVRWALDQHIRVSSTRDPSGEL